MSPNNESNAENQSLKRYVKFSLIFHVGLFLALTIQATFFSEAPIPFEKAVRVDIVGLPDKVQPPAPAPSAPPTPTPEPPAPPTTMPPKKEPTPTPVVKAEPPKPKAPTKPKEPDAINLDRSKNKQKQALEKLRQMEALEEIQKQVETDNKKKVATAASQVKYKGNVLNSGSELTGLNKLQAEDYYGDVYNHIMNNWSAPAYFKNRNLKTNVMVRLDENGNVLSKDIVKSSGNTGFDELVLNAIQKSSPVPPPPAKFSRIVSVEGIMLRFSPDSE
jgi:colicin import membrane protein